MKKYSFILAMVIISVFGACKKDGSGNEQGDPVTSEATAKQAFLKINSLWTATLKPLIAKTKKTYKDEAISGPVGGQAVINGTYYTTNASSSSSSTNTSNMDLVVSFNNYSANGITLNGTLRFFDFSESRSACSSSGCAFSNHSSQSYSTSDGSGNNFLPLGIQFDNNGSKVNDKILIRASKSDNLHWGIKVTNNANDVFSFSY